MSRQASPRQVATAWSHQAQANGKSLTASTPIHRGVGSQIWIPARARDREMYI
jgi:hypothetical protein